MSRRVFALRPPRTSLNAWGLTELSAKRDPAPGIGGTLVPATVWDSQRTVRPRPGGYPG